MKKKINRVLLAVVFALFSGQFSSFAQCANEANVYSFVYDGRTYEVIKENKSWTDAVACAVERGGYLAEINSQAEQDVIYAQLSAKAGINKSNTIATEGGGAPYVWLGGNDLATEGKWIFDGNNDGTGTQFWQGYSNGSAVGGLYNNWGHGKDGNQHEPDNYHNATYNIPHQNALAIALTEWQAGSGNLGQAGQWNDIYENNTLYFLIEYDSLKGSSNGGGSLGEPLGSGTSSDPYQISSLENLVWLAKTDSIWDDGLSFVQTANIDASATDTMTISGFDPGWGPIGNALTSFTGSYDGGGFTIDGLTTHGHNANVGLFGIVKGLIVKNLGLTNVNFTAGGRSGALIGSVDSSLIVSNCYATGNIEFDGPFGGGLIGVIKDAKFEITDSYTDITIVNVMASDYAFTGGFISYIELFGDNDLTGSITDCYSKGDVSLTAQAGKSSHVGGFIAKLGGDEAHTTWSEIKRCYSTGNVVGTIGFDGYSPSGGFIGEADWRYNISECYSTGNVTSKGKDTGGFIGYLKYEGHVSNCYSTGDVTRVDGSTQMYFGGFIGWQRPWGAYHNVVEKCYSTGKVIGVDNPGYGFLGGKDSPCVDTLNYYDKEASLQDSTLGNALGKTTSEMKTEATFTGWDFANTWEIKGENYPTLRSIAVLLPVTKAERPAGNGTELDPYQIATLGNLSWLAQNDSAWGKYYVQTTDIDASETVNWDDADDNGDGDKYNDQNDVKYSGNNEGWFPIGSETKFFLGSYDGGNHTIDGITLKRPDLDYVGFFGNMRKDFGSVVEIKDLGLTNVKIIGGNYVGGFIGQNFAGTITNCYSTGVVASSGATGYIAGFVGYNNTRGSLIERCYSEVTVTYDGSAVDAFAGGFVGRNRTPYESGAVINECYCTGDVTTSGTRGRVGGFAGQQAFAKITNCYSLSKLHYTGGGDQVGGFTGRSYSDTIAYCYYAGELIADSVSSLANTKGFVGTNNNNNTYIANFLDTLVSGANQSAIDSAATEKGTVAMKLESTFTSAGWDFVNVWEIKGDNYPTLQMKAVSVEKEDNEVLPSSYALDQNYPNPFNPSTKISFRIPSSGNVNLSIYNVLGQKVTTLVDGELSAGNYTYQFDASNLSSGIYLYRLEASNFTSVKKMMLLK